MNPKQFRSDITTILDTLLTVHNRLIHRQIDVDTIGTKRDWDDLYEAQDAYEEARKIAIGKLVKLVAESEESS